MMKKAIENFAEQFSYDPVIKNAEHWQKAEKFVLCGMGGSHLQGDIARMLKPSLDLMIHSDYGLPECVGKDRAFVISSYSGNTEESISAFREAAEKGFPLMVSSTGGELLELAKKHKVPYVQIPDAGIQPRSALGYTLWALLKLLGEEELLGETGKLAGTLDPREWEAQGKELAQRIRGKIPVIYSSRKNQPIAYNFKIKFNESAKVPAFFNVFPELNHNEMEGFGAIGSTEKLIGILSIIFLEDGRDHSKIQERIELTKDMYKKRGVQVESIKIQGNSMPERIFSALLIADWAAWHTGKEYGSEPEETPMIEELKKRIAG